MYPTNGYGLGMLGAPGGSVPGNQKGNQGLFALRELPSRDTYLRRQIYRQFWHEKDIAAGASGPIKYFKETSSSTRVSNMDQPGSIPVRKAVLLKKLVVKLAFGSSAADQANFYERVIINLKIEGDDAYSFLAFTLNTGVGFTGGTSLQALGEPAPQKAFDLGMIPLGAGQSFHVLLDTSESLATANSNKVTVYLHTLTDEPIS